MSDTLSYKQLFDELETLNSSAYNFIYNGDLDGFKELIDEFLSSGITEQERFPIARQCYRFAQTPFTINGLWLGVNEEKLLNDYIFHFFSMGRTINDIKADTIYPIYMNLADLLSLSPEEREQERQERLQNRLHDKRVSAFLEYIELYEKLYTINVKSQSIFSNSLVENVKDYQALYLSKILELTKLRSKLFITFNFTCKQFNLKTIVGRSTNEKINILSRHLPNIYEKTDETGNTIIDVNIKDYLTFEDKTTKVIASNYLQGKYIDRKNWKKYCQGTFPTNPLFYLELAFYLSIPSSNEIEKFMNHHGYSIKSQMTFFQDICCGKNTYHVLYKDLCRWIDAGIDYNLINELFGYQLEVKETRKS